jgi:bifunctional non-homologous end joining protein LigD
VRLITRGGYDWTKRYTCITEAARKVRQKAVRARRRGRHRRRRWRVRLRRPALGQAQRRVQFCAFDLLVECDDDLRKLPLHLRKTNLERLLARRPEGIFVNPFERGAFESAWSVLLSSRTEADFQACRDQRD